MNINLLISDSDDRKITGLVNIDGEIFKITIYPDRLHLGMATWVKLNPKGTYYPKIVEAWKNYKIKEVIEEDTNA